MKPLGLVNGLRKANDGVAFFGTQAKNGEEHLIDFVLNSDISNSGPYLFIIYYKKEAGKYFLKSYKDKLSTVQNMAFIRLEKEYVYF